MRYRLAKSNVVLVEATLVVKNFQMLLRLLINVNRNATLSRKWMEIAKL